MPKLIDLQQGSPEWLAFRKDKITASEIATIMGVNPYETPYQLWQRKLDIIPGKEVSPAMLRGKELEPVALQAYSALLKVDMQPAVVVSDHYPWAMASLDGVSSDLSLAVEIKIMGKNNHDEAMTGHVKPLYMYQMQWQMLCLDITMIDYFAWSEDSAIVTLVQRDDALISQMIEAAAHFFALLRTYTPPPLTDRDYIDRSNDEELSQMLDHYKFLTTSLKKMEKSATELKEKIISYCDGISTKTANGKISKVVTKGRVDYSQIPELKNLDLDCYRSEPTISYRIS